MRQNASPQALDGAWKPAFPGQIPDELVIAEELKGNVIDLEGRELVAVELGHTDTDYSTCLHVPSIGLVVAGDAAYNDDGPDIGTLAGLTKTVRPPCSSHRPKLSESPLDCRPSSNANGGQTGSAMACGMGTKLLVWSLVSY